MFSLTIKGFLLLFPLAQKTGGWVPQVQASCPDAMNGCSKKSRKRGGVTQRMSALNKASRGKECVYTTTRWWGKVITKQPLEYIIVYITVLDYVISLNRRVKNSFLQPKPTCTISLVNEIHRPTFLTSTLHSSPFLSQLRYIWSSAVAWTCWPHSSS